MQNTSFEHSVKVPKLYKCAAKISQEVARGSGSIKQLVYEKKHFNTKALYALVVTTFQKAKEIDLLLKRTKLLEKESRLDPWLAKILISEILWGKKQLPNSDAKPIRTILAYEQVFHAHLSDSSADNQSVKPEKPENYKKPRYVRINTLLNSFNEALDLFQEEGWILQKPDEPYDYESFLKQVSNLEGDCMLRDMHIPDLLIFPAGTEFFNHPGYKKGTLVLQDKASCLPVYILSPPPGSIILDMCAAPGMKTTQLATMLNNEGIVYAVERDLKRFKVLNEIVASSGATCIRTINKDILQCGDSDFPDVEYILVDPSCSASGMVDRLEIHQKQDPLRLQKLAGFQIKILRSALTRYPKVKKVVYSTCSLYPEENEDVVRQVLETNNQFKLVSADKFINKAWKNFGSPDFGDIGRYCLYSIPEEDLTNGFFVAVFERLEEGESNKFFNGRVLNYRKKVEQKLARKEKKLKEKLNGNELEKSEETSENNIKSTNLVLNSNNSEFIKENKKNKRKHGSFDPTHQDLENNNNNQFLKKKRKTDDIITLNDTEERQDLNNDRVATEPTDISNGSLSKRKSKKLKNVDSVTSKQTQHGEEYGITVMEGLSENSQHENKVDKKSIYISKNQKKTRKNRDLVEPEETMQSTDFTQQTVENIGNNFVDTHKYLKKTKKKKRKYNEFANLENTYEESKKIDENMTQEYTEQFPKNSKKKKKKNKTLEQSPKEEKEIQFDIQNENLKNVEIEYQVVSKPSKNKKNNKREHSARAKLKHNDEEYEEEQNSGSVVTKTKKKRKRGSVDNTL